MREQVEKALAVVAARYADRRLNVFRVQLQPGEPLRLSGWVLEQENLDALRAELAGVEIDNSAVKVLRHKATPRMIVATNLTDLHVETSFLSELLTQMTNGTVVEILEEKDKWAFVRQADGYLGWAYKPYLAQVTPLSAHKPTHIVLAASPKLYAERTTTPEPITRLLGGTYVEVIDVYHESAHVRPVGGVLPAGWLPLGFLRALDELPLAPRVARQQIIEDARGLRGVYYLWGGTSAFGIDCSGLSHLMHRLSGYTIPRDADMQFAAARPIEPPYHAGDLFFFHSDTNPNKISHVGICTGEWHMIHSSRTRNGVYEDDVQATPHLCATFAGARTFLS